MAFLDNLVSDLVRSSTGFNARPIVRAVGGKNLLLLGGAAIAGALAAQKVGGQKPGTVPSPAPPPPPVPGAVPPPVPPPPPPRLPVAEAGETEEIPQPLLFAIVRTLIAGALADGKMHADEKKIIEARLSESGLSPELIQRIHKDLVLPPSPDELAALVQSPEDAEVLYRFGALVVLADSETMELERTWLEKLAGALGISDERRRALDSELFEAT